MGPTSAGTDFSTLICLQSAFAINILSSRERALAPDEGGGFIIVHSNRAPSKARMKGHHQ